MYTFLILFSFFVFCFFSFLVGQSLQQLLCFKVGLSKKQFAYLLSRQFIFNKTQRERERDIWPGCKKTSNASCQPYLNTCIVQVGVWVNYRISYSPIASARTLRRKTWPRAAQLHVHSHTYKQLHAYNAQVFVISRLWLRLSVLCWFIPKQQLLRQRSYTLPVTY